MKSFQLEMPEDWKSWFGKVTGGIIGLVIYGVIYYALDLNFSFPIVGAMVCCAIGAQAGTMVTAKKEETT